MQKRLTIFLIIVFMPVLLIFSSCRKQDDNIELKKDKIIGSVQKGPYVNGTTIQMYELNSSLNQTGRAFSTQIINNRGSFEINNIALSSQYVEFIANGYYFNEISGVLSPSQLSLSAVSDISDLSTVNVNILTHLEKCRVEFWVNNGISFSEAKTNAQKEILGIFGFQSLDLSNSEELDISVDKDENAVLLAISLILQGERSVADLTELLAIIITDIRNDGILNDQSIIDQLRETTLAFDSLPRIRYYLERRYLDLGITAAIPNFEKYLDLFLTSTGSKPLALRSIPTNINMTSATLNGWVMANDLSTTVTFEYGETFKLGNIVEATPNLVTGHIITPVSAEINGLNSATNYFYVLKAVNNLGTTTAEWGGLTTLDNPLVLTKEATNVTATEATLNGIVNPNNLNTTVIFEYKYYISVGNFIGFSVAASQSPVTGNTDTPVSATITGLQSKTNYLFRVKTSNSLGTITGREFIFQTL